MTALTPQQRFVLDRLRERGDRGVHTFELRREFISNPSQRVTELEGLGYQITTSAKERLNGRALGVRYRLVRAADGRPETDPTPPSAPGVRSDGCHSGATADSPASTPPSLRAAGGEYFQLTLISEAVAA